MGEFRELRDEFTRFMLCYQFGIDEVTTKIKILQQEFTHIHAYNPIEHVSSRLKTPEGVLAKAQRRGVSPDLESVRAEITDIAGVRVTCAFVSDVYRVFDLFTGQQDVQLMLTKDYIASPKPNGYRSLHAIVQVPVFLSDETVLVPVEVQFRTIAMDFWASLEHKIYYKYETQVPQQLLDGLHEAATTAARLDSDMEQLHHEIRGHPEQEPVPQAAGPTVEVSDRALAALRDFIAADEPAAGSTSGSDDRDAEQDPPPSGPIPV
ncbi:GTP pyrophosphokinase family protein [Luteipulveratus sp. YIM 133132]|uniref:GTP pyrophosphokinase family protein n=2 Tax=Luteipulveratus flavus TaxID=3031728 RepID=A0ABT6C8N3_9MICO|nr:MULTISPECIES: GTP pyrophosphokinase family protein [unclassified Luteipulveratus]MDE9366720.1 GTP pyrophosphokinase family protein [Luteipulveratus sp. YIM 133132]MDF8263651.1 GTP pyrophosphokinase family protein [Luteipulveratus sp. YIM 133296]